MGTTPEKPKMGRPMIGDERLIATTIAIAPAHLTWLDSRNESRGETVRRLIQSAMDRERRKGR